MLCVSKKVDYALKARSAAPAKSHTEKGRPTVRPHRFKTMAPESETPAMIQDEIAAFRARQDGLFERLITGSRIGPRISHGEDAEGRAAG